MMVAWLFQVEASPSYYFNPYFNNNSETIHQQENEDKIEAYLQNQVPGLNVSYRDVIDAMIEHGFEVFLKGGVIRDLISHVPSEPQDVDLGFNGKLDDLEQLLKKKGWMYYRKPEGWILIIGDHRSNFIEAVPIISQDFGENSNDYKEFTINSIYYSCNSKCFLSDSIEGLKDLSQDRLKTFTDDWQKWLQSTVTLKYYKIFRFWKMVGKGYVFNVKFGDFLACETQNNIANDKEEFIFELRNYLSKHFHSFDDVYHGCIAAMGYEWAKEHLYFLKDEALQRSLEIDSEMDLYTYFPTNDVNLFE